MSFRFYTNVVSQASKTVAAGMFVAGLLLVGFAVIIAALPEIVGYLAAAIFFVAGIGCSITAIKIFWAQRKLDKADPDHSGGYRENVQIHIEEHYDA